MSALQNTNLGMSFSLSRMEIMGLRRATQGPITTYSNSVMLQAYLVLLFLLEMRNNKKREECRAGGLCCSNL